MYVHKIIKKTVINKNYLDKLIIFYFIPFEIGF